ANEIGAEWPVVIGVGFAVRNGIKFFEGFSPPAIKYPDEQVVPCRVVVCWTSKWNAPAWVVTQTHAEAIRLYAVVSVAVHTGCLGRNTVQQSTRAIVFNTVGTDITCKPMFVVQDSQLNAVPLFVVGRFGFSPHMIAHTSLRHQITFVSGVDKHLSRKCFARYRSNRLDGLPGFDHPGTGAIKAFLAIHLNPFVRNPSFEYVFRHMGLENPHCSRLAIHGRSSLPLVSIRFSTLPAPSGILSIMVKDLLIKLPRPTTDNGFIPGIGKA